MYCAALPLILFAFDRSDGQTIAGLELASLMAFVCSVRLKIEMVVIVQQAARIGNCMRLNLGFLMLDSITIFMAATPATLITARDQVK